MTSLDFLFRPRSIALVGAAQSEEKLGGVILRNLLRFRGAVYPVNPKRGELMGLTVYPSPSDLPGPVDLAIILRPAAEVSGILRAFAQKATGVIVMSAGFAEIGEEGLQEEIRTIGKETGMRILGPNCMGVFNPSQRLDTFFLPRTRLERPGRGNVAIVSQSGAILSCLLGAARESRTGVSVAVGYGNAVDIGEAEIYDHLSKDRSTEVAVSYIESVADGRRFIASAGRLSQTKPLLVLKAGKGTSGQAAAFSHTGRLAGRYEVFRSVLRRFGIPEVRDFEELMDGAKALSLQRPSKGRRICIITNGGGSGVLAADECMRQGLEVPPVPAERREVLAKLFPPFYGLNNPIDLTAQVTDADYLAALGHLKDDYDGFLVIALSNVLGITEALPEIMRDFMKGLGKPLVFHVARGGISERLASRLERTSIPVYPTPERAVRALRFLLT